MKSIARTNHELDLMRSLRSELEELSKSLGVETRAQADVDLSIVIPAFNERSRLPKTTMDTIRWCHRNLRCYEVLIVDDGSSDDTLEISRLISGYDRNVRVIACPHRGKGAAVRMGLLNAKGNSILFMDADGATPLDEIPKLAAKMGEGYALAIGSRVVLEEGDTTVETSLHRKLIGRTFAALVNLFGVRGIRDTQCGFKMFKRDAARALFSRQKIDGFAFDVEVLFLARRFAYPIAEVPVNWVNQRGSKVNLFTDSATMLKDILKIRLQHWKTTA